LSGLPADVPGTTVNRLCGSGLDALGLAARSIRSGDCELMLAGLIGAAENDVVDTGPVDGRIALHQRRKGDRREIIGSDA
jgi:hypothetical protein